MNHPNILIIGGGPVGAALALDLASRGVSSVVVESRTTLPNIPKGQGLTQRTLEHFYFWGLVEELRAARIMPRGSPIGEITAYGNLLSDYWHAPAGREVVAEFFFQKQERLPQYRMEAVLRRKLAMLPNVSFRLGVTATAVTQSADGVRATVTNERGESETLEADYLVGCDGGHSMVREAGRHPPQRHRFRPDHGAARVPLARIARAAQALSRALDLPRHAPRPARLLEILWAGRCRRGLLLPRTGAKRIPTARTSTTKQCCSAPPDLNSRCEVEHAGFWDLRNAVAANYRNRRIFIAGDAAHSHPPYGGYGLNNGLEDAVNLSWKLAARLAGWGGERLLDSYSAEREPVFRDVAEDFIAARIREDDDFLTRYNPARDRAEFEAAWKAQARTMSAPRRKAYEPHYGASPIVFGAPDDKTTAHGVHSLKAQAGHHLSPQVLSNGRNVFEELGRDFTLLAFGADTGNFEQAAQAARVPLKIVRDNAPAARENYGAALILVRPDQHVAWAGQTAPDADEIMRKVTGQ